MRKWIERIFVNSNILRLWSGQVISQTGDSMFQIGLLWLALEVTGSNAMAGSIAMMGYLPTLLFGLLAGALADRADKRMLMLAADFARGIVVLFVPVLYFVDGLSGLVLGLITFGIALFNAVFNPARDSLTVLLARKEQLIRANSLIHTSWQFALLLGPPLAGLLIPLVGIVHLFTIDAATFFLSFYCIYLIRVPKVKTVSDRASFWQLLHLSWRDVAEGLRYARADRRIWALLMITLIDNLFIMGPAIIGAPIFVREVLKEGVSSYAYLELAYAVGMLIGTVGLNLVSHRYRKSHVLLWGIILDGITFLPLLWVTTFWGAFLTVVVHATVIPMIIIPRPTLIQKVVPHNLQGRVFSMIDVAVVGCTAVSLTLTGIVAEFVPINIIFGFISFLAAGSGAVGWLIKEFRDTE